MVDHDQRFKEVLREFLVELLALFFPRLAARLRMAAAAWEPQEIFTNPPLGLVRRVDLLARVPEVATAGERLLHFEVSSAESLTEVRKAIGYYYPGLRTRHNLPVTPLAVYLKVGLAGRGWDEYVEEDPDEEEGELPYQVRWRYVGLPALPAERYLTCDNWLGVALAALMRIEPGKKPWLRAEILRRLATECRENDYRKLLLMNLVETYLPLEGQEELEFLRLMRDDPRYRETQNVVLTTYDKGVAAGVLQGNLDALRRMLIRLGRPRCGEPDEATRRQIQAIEDVAVLEGLIEIAQAATSWEQLLAGQPSPAT